MKAMTFFVLTGSCVAMAVAGCGEDAPLDDTNTDGGASSSSSSSGASSSSSSSGASSSSSSSGDGGASSSSSGDGGDGGGGGEWSATCDEQAAYGLQCDPQSTLDAERQDCLEESPCFDDGMRPGAAKAVKDCLVARECGTGDDECFAETGVTLGGQATTDFATTCMEKLEACENQDEGFQDDYCGTSIGLFKDAVLNAANACLAGACNAMGECMDAAIATVAPGCVD